MSSGGSNPSSPTGATGDQPTTAKIESPIPKGPNAQPGGSYSPATPPTPEAPGGKGGFPAAQNPYSQQQPQVYMPPSQPTFYDQAFNHPYYQQPPQYYQQQPQYYQQAPQYYQQQPQYYQPAPQITSYGLAGLSGSMGNAYARRPRFSPPSPFNGGRMSPIEAQPPMDEMRMSVMGGGFQQSRSLGPYTGGFGNNEPGRRFTGGFGNSVASPPSGGFGSNVPEPGPQGLPFPVEATRGVASDNMNNPAYQQQLAASNMTDYQRLMQRQQAASQPQPNYGAGLGGLEQNFRPSAPSDFEIATSLGFKDPHAARSMLTWAKDPMADQVEKDRAEQSKAYLNSIGYGQSGFDASKYEVKRQPVSTGPRTGLGALLGGV